MSSHKIAIRIVTLFLATLILAGCGGAEGRKAKYLERGKNYLKEEKYDKAAVELKNVLQIDPKHAEAYFLLARVEEEKRNYKPAFGYYSKALELKPDYPEARAKLARFYLLSGNIAKATEMTEALLAKNPADLDARLLKAAIMSRQGNDRGAIQMATDIMSAQPDYSDAIEFAPGDEAAALRWLEYRMNRSWHLGDLQGDVLRYDPATRSMVAFTLVGAAYLALISLLPIILFSGLKVANIPFIGDALQQNLPEFLTSGLGLQFAFGGTSILIVVGVAMDTVQQIESQLIMRHYDSFMKKTRIRGRRG
jgi:tetratricopeptide (TPR) repeat protein